MAQPQAQPEKGPRVQPQNPPAERKGAQPRGDGGRGGRPQRFEEVQVNKAEILRHVPQLFKSKVSLALERNTRVILTRVPDTHITIDIARQGDRALKNLRNQMCITLDAQDVIDCLREHRNAITEYDRVTALLCKKANLPYRSPLLDTPGPGKDNGKGKRS